MIGFLRKVWRRHKVRAAEHRMYLDQGYAPHDAQSTVGTSWNSMATAGAAPSSVAFC